MFLMEDEMWDYLYEQFLQAEQTMKEFLKQLSESIEIFTAEADSPEDETKPKPLDFSCSTPGRFLWPLIPWYTSGFT